MAEQLSSHIQTKSEGVGPLYHRVYRLEFRGSRADGLKAMRHLMTHTNDFSPQWLATFEKVRGSDRCLKVGDEFQIYISGPWNGPVRVAEVTDDSFKLLTLAGHLEAGEIHFRILSVSEGVIRFEIESLARSKDHIVDFFYDKLPVAKMAQQEMWREVCVAFARFATGSRDERIGDVEIITERRDEETGQWQRI